MPWVRAVADDEVWAGELRGVRVAGVPVLLVRLDEGLFAFVDRCAHQAVPLSEGTLDGAVITCRAHGWSYDARSGHGVNPACARLRAIPVRVEGGDIFVDLAGLAGDARRAEGGP